MKGHAKLIGIIGICILAIVCIWAFCTNIGSKPAPVSVSTKQEQTTKPLDAASQKKLADKLTDFSNINTKPVNDPGF